jgi:hypothetical protein
MMPKGALPPDDKRCIRPTRDTGERCKRFRHPGATVCVKHGAAAPQVKRKAAERVKQEAAERAVATFGLPREVAPDQALLEEIARTAGHIDWLGRIIADLEQAALVWGKSKTEDVGASEFTGQNVTEQAAPNVWLELYQKERAHLVVVCKAAISAGIEERRVKLAEQHGALLADVLRSVFADPELGMSDEQRRAAPHVVRRHLASVGA